MSDPPCTATSCGIYQITNKRTGRRYIGQTTQTFDTRWRYLKSQGRHSSRELQADWHELGSDAFEFEVLEVCPDDLSEEERYTWCNEREIAHIGGDWRIDDLYNDRPGGGNSPMSEEARRKLSETATGRTHTKETKKKMSKLKLGENNPNYGGLSDEHRQNISKSLTGKPKSEETKKKMSIAAKNRPKKPCQFCDRLISVSNHERHEKSCKHRPQSSPDAL